MKKTIIYFLTQIISRINPQALLNDIYNKCVYAFNLKIKLLNIRYKTRGAPDELPLPPIRLIYLVTGQHSIEAFYQNGKHGADCIKEILQKNRLDINTFDTILDFGCGCGRIMRHWKELNGPTLYGVDYNVDLLKWCRKYLPFAQYEVNKLASGLKFNDGMFDFVYAISVFTHLSEELQSFWMKEFKRILKPGGVLLITVHGITRLNQLSKARQQQFFFGQSIVVGQQFSGTNLCCAYHPEQYVKNVLAKDFKLLDFLPRGAKDANQDMYLFQKTPACGPK